MHTLTTSEDVAAFCNGLSQHDFITIDTEFLREKTYYPKLCLVQISGPDKDARAIDPLIEGIDLAPLFALFQNKNITKVFHAGRQDLEIFYNMTGTVPAPIFDTQIAAMVCGYGDSIGYEKLVSGITGGTIDKSSQFTDWSIRPLSDKQLTYALGDVTHLCDVYVHLKSVLDKRGRTGWVMQEEEVLCNPATYQNDPYKAWERIKIRSPKPRNLVILREIAALRENMAQKRNIPKTWVMKDDVLASIAGQAPKNAAQLAKTRNLSKDMAEGKIGDQLLKAIETALASPQDTWPVPKTKVHLQPAVMTIVDILKMLLKIESTEHEVAAKIIASSSDLEAIALDDDADVPALKGWRREIFGEDALAIKHGKLAIGLKNGKIAKLPID
tara:strand:- start:14525 stop:15679 length:1155 start_codon:yes stop_codon:yes gene_type:complete